jgi:nucleoside-diphosphate-sugar epimerase
MKVLVTGHRGYIGVEMVSVLRKAGHEVIGLDNGYFDECDFRAPPDDIPCIKQDLRDVAAKDLAGVDAVCFLAALSNDPLGDLNPNLTFDINLHGSVRFAEAAKAAGVQRFLFSSSCSLYGAGGTGFLDEDAPFNPVTPYGKSKVEFEQAVSRLADESFTPVYLRNATAYGVSRRLRADIVVNNLVGHALTTGKVLLQSDGTPWRPLVHIRDIIHAFETILVAPREFVHNQAFNVGRTSENFQIRDVARMVAEVVPDCELAFAPGASADARDYRVDFGKIEKTLAGYRPQWTLRKGVEELYQAYRDGGMTKEEWLGPRYYRLKTILGLRKDGRVDNDLRRTR